MAFLLDLPKRHLAMAGMALAMLIYGSNFVLSRHAVLNGLSAHDMLALRFAVAGLVLLPVFWRAGVAGCAGVGWRRGLILTVMAGFPMSFLMMQGLTMAPAAHGASIGPGTVTLIGIIGGVLLFGTQLTAALMVGVAIVLAGLLALALSATTAAHMPNLLLGDLCFLGVGLIWGGYPLLLQFWKIDGLKATAIVSVLSMAYLPVYALVYFRGFDVAPWQAIVFHGINQGLINVVVGLWLWAWATKILGVAVAGRFPPMIPVIGTLLGMPVLGEWPGPVQLVGIGMIVAGLFIAAWKPPPKAAAGTA
ncbi:MAG: DMT family transporter [Beijerinckiaceae bacterium]|jgi:drug/metabolite transporter (DMT)-like permease|nr:DMT family transporter [Beijerinckiaceae bacterium]